MTFNTGRKVNRCGCWLSPSEVTWWVANKGIGHIMTEEITTIKQIREHCGNGALDTGT
jgi:hypothetical protein